jgi:hypothetical protein
MIKASEQALSLSEIIVWIDDHRLAALRLRQYRMRQPFFDDQPESEAMSCLGQKIRDNDRFSRTGHSKQDTVLRSVSQPRPYPDKIASGAIVYCLGPFQVPGERRGPGNQVRQVGVFGG